jgi:L-ribulose-5-phosphate 3-epimerase
MNIAGHDIGVCSWSLRPRDMGELIEQMKQLDVQHLQLALNPLLNADESGRSEQIRQLRESDLVLTAGMVGFPGEDYSSIAMIRETGGFLPDAAWPARRELALQAGRLAAEMKIELVSTHAGFIPPSSHEGYRVMLQRLGEVADEYASLGLDLLLETGQERAPELLQFLNDLSSSNVHVNFDPANMILYGAGDPIEAIRILSRHIQHVHVKDALLSEQPGIRWGDEVPFGTGQVPPAEFLRALGDADYTGPLVIEREAGNERLLDVQRAIQTLQRFGKSSSPGPAAADER